MRISRSMLIGTILTGIIYFILGEIFYNAFQDRIPMVLLIGIYFFGLALFVVIGSSVIVAALYHATAGYRDIVLRCIILCTAIFVSAMFLEFLYELNGKNKNMEPTSYIFLMDNSGSMSTSDPQNQRYEAIQSVISGKEQSFPFAVYSFSNESKLIRSMNPVSQGTEFQMEEPEGGTGIRATLDKLYKDIENGVTDPGENGRVILFSDGYATDISLFTKAKLNGLLKKYAKARISISTVGLGKTDHSLMSKIAGKTGGVYINVDNADMLNDAINEAAVLHHTRNLLDYRDYVKLDFLFMLLRFAAIVIIGLLLAGIKTYISEPVLDTQPVLISSLIGSFLASLCVEIGMNTLGLPAMLMRLLMCVFLSVAALYEMERRSSAYGAQYEYY